MARATGLEPATSCVTGRRSIDLCINNAIQDTENVIIGAQEEHLCPGREVVPICWKTDAGVL